MIQAMSLQPFPRLFSMTPFRLRDEEAQVNSVFILFLILPFWEIESTTTMAHLPQPVVVANFNRVVPNSVLHHSTHRDSVM